MSPLGRAPARGSSPRRRESGPGPDHMTMPQPIVPARTPLRALKARPRSVLSCPGRGRGRALHRGLRMRKVLAYPGGSLEFPIEDERSRGRLGRPADPSRGQIWPRRARLALAGPIDLPPLSLCVVPGDRVVIAAGPRSSRACRDRFRRRQPDGAGGRSTRDDVTLLLTDAGATPSTPPSCPPASRWSCTRPTTRPAWPTWRAPRRAAASI